MTPIDAGPAAGLDPGLDAGFLPRDAVPGQQGRAGSGFTSGHAFDTSRPGPALAQALDAATASTDGHTNLDDDELIGVLAGWAKTEAWAAAGRLAAVAELAARRPPLTRKEAATRGGQPAGWNKFCADEAAARARAVPAVRGTDGPAGPRPGHPAPIDPAGARRRDHRGL